MFSFVVSFCWLVALSAVALEATAFGDIPQAAYNSARIHFLELLAEVRRPQTDLLLSQALVP